MKTTLSVLLILCFSTIAMSQSIIGEWNNIDENSGEINSTITIEKKGDSYFGKITHITDPLKRVALCEKCKGEQENKPILGMEILRNLEKKGDRYEGGKILDPKTGSDYKCAIWIDEDNKNKLKVRGYLGFFYTTREWVRK